MKKIEYEGDEYTYELIENLVEEKERVEKKEFPTNKSYTLNDYIPFVGNVSINFNNSDIKMFEFYKNTNELNRQANIKHLGIISKCFPGAQHTRKDYLMLQLILIDMITKMYKGNQNVGMGNISVSGNRVTGDSILRFWAMFSNLGHMKNTIADEKSIMNLCIKDKKYTTRLISVIKDRELRLWSRAIIENYVYEKFHYVISLYRFYKYQYRKKDTNKYIDLIKMLLLPEKEITFVADTGKLHQLKNTYNVIRSVSILKMDGQYTHLPLEINLFSIVNMLSHNENNFMNVHFKEILRPLIGLFIDEIYTAKEVLVLERNYEYLASVELDSMIESHASIDEIISKGLIEGYLDKENYQIDYQHFIRMKLPFSDKFDFAKSEQFGDVLSKYSEGVLFLIDGNYVNHEYFLDVLIKDGFDVSKFSEFLNEFVMVITNDLINGFMKKDDEENNELYIMLLSFEDEEVMTKYRKMQFSKFIGIFEYQLKDTFKDLLWNILGYIFDDKYYIDIENHISYEDVFCMKVDNGGISGIDNIKSIYDLQSAEATNKGSKYELEHIYKIAKRKYNGIVLAIMGGVNVYDKTLPPNHSQVTDIDGIVMRISNRSIEIQLIETKSYKSKAKRTRIALEEVNDKFTKIVVQNRVNYQIKKVENFGAKMIVKLK